MNEIIQGVNGNEFNDELEQKEDNRREEYRPMFMHLQGHRFHFIKTRNALKVP